jgi:hypothetical protein
MADRVHDVFHENKRRTWKLSPSREDGLQRFAHGRREGRILVDVVMAGFGDGPVEGEIGDCEPERLGARRNNQGVAPAGDQPPQARSRAGSMESIV